MQQIDDGQNSADTAGAAGQVTLLLAAVGQGRDGALGELYALLYPELHRLAHARIRRSKPFTLLDTTALLHESFLRFQQSKAVALPDRDRFMAYAAHVMRSVVVDNIRRSRRERHGGDVQHVEFDDSMHSSADDQARDDVLRVHELLGALEQIDARLVRVVEMRYFAGLTEPEVAGVLGVTVRTIARDWEKARLYLRVQLR
jgi:RNA polymerase sigma factor (TIGR02999 family)